MGVRGGSCQKQVLKLLVKTPNIKKIKVEGP